LRRGGIVLDLLICTAITRGDVTSEAIVEMTSPSGFEFDDKKLDFLKERQLIKQWELFDSNSRVYLYLDLVDEAHRCFNLRTTRTNLVTNLAGGFAKVYDYYDKTRNAETFYFTGRSVQQRQPA